MMTASKVAFIFDTRPLKPDTEPLANVRKDSFGRLQEMRVGAGLSGSWEGLARTKVIVIQKILSVFGEMILYRRTSRLAYSAM